MPLRRSCPLLGIQDTDTLRVDWEGHPRPARLIDVDPEHAAPGGPKPSTEFGRRTYRWAQETALKGLGEVILEFPAEEVVYSNSGKLLAYVFARGENYNLRLVREGFSPCFTKYGHPRVHREEMEQAEMLARFEGRGVWGGRGGRGDYQALKAYWLLRAGQIESCRHSVAMGEDVLGCRSDYREIVARAKVGTTTWVFAELVRSFHMADGSVLIQLGSPHKPLSAFFPPGTAVLAGFLERECVGFGKPNYLYFHGPLSMAGDHPQITVELPDQVRTCPPKTV